MDGRVGRGRQANHFLGVAGAGMLTAAKRRGAARARHAFTLVEIIVALLLMATLAAVLIPALTSRMNGGEAAAIIDDLKQIRIATVAYRDNVGRYPRKLAQLSQRPSVAVGDTDLCNVGTLPQASIDSWRGPYLAQRVTSAGLQVGSSTIRNDMDRDPTAPTAANPEGFLRVAVDSVSETVATEVDRAFDPLTVSGTADLGLGAVTWSASVLRFWIAIRGC